MADNYDFEGFLIGEIVYDIRRQSTAIDSIRNDVAAIKAALSHSLNSNRNNNSRRSSGVNPPTGPAIEPPIDNGTQRSRRTRRTAQPNGNAGNAGNSSLAQQNSESVQPGSPPGDRSLASQASAANRLRNARGQFVRGDGSSSASQGANAASGDSDNNGDKKSATATLNIGAAIDRFSAVIDTSRNGLENVDPTIKAMNEVAQPIKSVASTLFGRDSKDRWFKRIFREISLFRREETTFSRAAGRSLENIEENSQSGSSAQSSGSSSFLGGLLGSILAPIMAILSTLGATLLSGITSVLGVVFGPIGLAVGTAALAAWGFFTEDGRKFFADVGQKFLAVWQDTTNLISAKWNEAVQYIQEIIEPIAKFFKDKLGIVKDTVTEAANTANDYVRSKTGVDVKATAQSTYQKASKFARDNIIEPAASAAQSAKEWFLGKTSKMFESGRGGAATVSSGKGDHGGVSYGTYQLSSKKGVVQDFLANSKYGVLFRGLQPGTKEFDERWKQVAKMDGDFGQAQHDYIKATHFDKQMDVLKNSGIDLSSRGSAVHDAVWSTSVQFGPETRLIKKALNGMDVGNLSDDQIISAIQDYKIQNNDSLFKSSSDRTREGTLNRAYHEKTKLLNLATAQQAAYAASPSMPAVKMPAPQKVPPAPNVLEPIATGMGGNRGLTVAIKKGDVSQDLGDRAIAHIVTGGLGGV